MPDFEAFKAWCALSLGLPLGEFGGLHPSKLSSLATSTFYFPEAIFLTSAFDSMAMYQELVLLPPGLPSE